MPNPTRTKRRRRPRSRPADKLVVTRHRARLAAATRLHRHLRTIVLKEESEKDGKAESDKARASVFFVAYTLDAPSPSRAR